MTAASPDEVMIAAAAAELRGVRTVFVGIGLPNAAANLARQTASKRPASKRSGARDQN
jgi:acyl CoA:acetate/3-ketoacid CoA transferase beta subunit